jgi:hypothetical protein
MPDASITSTASAFGSIAGTFAADQSTIAGTITTITGTVNGSVGVPGPQGPQGPQGEEGPPGPPGPGSTWGTITGTLSAQTDLQTALDGKYSTSNPSGFITSSALTGYATQSWVTAGFYPLTSNPSGFITSSALTPYLQKAGGVITGDIQSNNGSGYRSYDGAYKQVNVSASMIQLLNADIGGNTLSIEWNGITFPSGKQTVHYPGTSILSGYATESWVTAGFAPIAAGQPTSGTVGQVLTKNSGTNYDSSWQTLIPGDRYLTASTTSLTINNANKTLTVGTGLSYSTQQDVIIAYDATHHMHCLVTAYNSSTGVMDVDVISHTGTGTYASWTVNVGGTVPIQSVEWGEILGTLGDQSDLATALNAKLEITDAASTYQTLAGMSSYLTTSAAASTYYLQTNPAGFITSSALTGYATQAWVDAQGYLQAGALTGYALESWVTSQGYLTDAPSDGSQYARKNGAWDVVSAGSSYITSVTAPLAVTSGDLSIDLTGYATESWVSGQGYLSAGALASLTSDVGFASGSAAGRLFIDGVYDPTSSGFTSARLNFGSSTPSQPSNGDFWTDGTTFKYFLGASYYDIASTNYVTSQGYITSSALIPYAPLASPSLSGTPTATTATADTNSTRIATTAFVVGQASSTTPAATGTAAVGTSLKYARADHVHANPLPTGGTTGQVLSKVNSTNYNVQWTTPSSGGGNDFQSYTTAGSFTWTKPANAKVVHVRMYGGGGGGGSGANQLTTVGRSGGGGGAGGSVIDILIPASLLGATETVVVGAGGTGGAAQATASTNGNPGTVGGHSSFSLWRAVGGSIGAGGIATATSGGTPTNTSVFGYIASTATGGGGNGQPTTGSNALANATVIYIAPSGGGGGAGAAASSFAFANGGAGGAKTAYAATTSGLNTLISGGAGGLTTGTLPTTGVTGGMQIGGTGGGGGAYRSSNAGMAGAVGAFPGGGGGGGSAADNLGSGAGGAGAIGAVYITTYC